MTSMRVILLCLVFAAACGGNALRGDDVDAGPDAAVCEGVDCSPDRPDAGEPGPDAGSDGECQPGPDTVVVDLAAAELPPDIAAAAEVPVASSEAGQPGALVYEVVVDEVSPSTAIPPINCGAGLETLFLLRWGHLPPLDPPVATEWADFSGYVAVSKGSVELVRALRWEGPTDPDEPRPRSDFVAAQSDPRLLRFTSSIGSGMDGLLLRFRRPVIEPVVIQIKLGPAVRVYPFEEHMSRHIVAGGWDVPVGQVEFHAWLQPESAACYVRDGLLDGTWSYAGASTALDDFTGFLARDDGTTEPMTFNATDLRGPYGSFAGSLGGSTVEGYYGRMWLFDGYDRRGNLIGRVVDASGETRQLFMGLYEDGEMVGSVAFRRADCDEPGAMHRSWFQF
jgi:hypothetical protein